MEKRDKIARSLRFVLLPLLLASSFIVAPALSDSGLLHGPLYVYAQTAAKVRSINCDFIQEENCPVAITNLRCNLDLDPFDAPMSSKIYLDYKNAGAKAVSAVKFRLRFVDAAGADRGTFHAVDSFYLTPGAEHGQKWKRDFTLHPQVVAMKVRVLQVKYAEGGDWQSVKMSELAGGGGQGGGTDGAAPSDGGGQ